MGCVMTINQHDTLDTDEDVEIKASTENHSSLNDLPDEVLVKIMSFLTETREKVKLRYVSKRIRAVSETPSLWHDFSWPDCSPREVGCLMSVMKACGAHIRQLSFPQRINQPVTLCSGQTPLKFMKMSEMTKILQCCTNQLTHLDIPIVTSSNGDSDKLIEAIEELKHLEVLSIHCDSSYASYLNLKAPSLKVLAIRTVIHFSEDTEALESWMINKFIPPNLNIIVLQGSELSAMVWFGRTLVRAWSRWNSQMPVDHVACLRLYASYKEPLNLFQNAPVFQLQYGKSAAFPFVQAPSVGITGQWLLITAHDDGCKVVHKAKTYLTLDYPIYSIIYRQGQNHFVSDLRCLTELDLSSSNLDIKSIIATCPQLQRLSLQKNHSLRLEDLQAIATCCNLQGLNLKDIPITDMMFCIKHGKF